MTTYTGADGQPIPLKDSWELFRTKTQQAISHGVTDAIADIPVCCDGETWKPIPLWPRYEASSCGQVRSLNWKEPTMMGRLRDYLSDIPVLTRLAANRAHVRASNWWHRQAERLHIDRPKDRWQNWLYRRAAQRGRDPLPQRAARSTPVYRNRINPATGRPRRDDVRLNRLDIGPARRMVEITAPAGRLLARWQGWSLSGRSAEAKADAMRTSRQRTPRGRSAR
jgi:hypothetical protein